MQKQFFEDFEPQCSFHLAQFDRYMLGEGPLQRPILPGLGPFLVETSGFDLRPVY